jgi:hypothetical protein
MATPTPIKNVQLTQAQRRQLEDLWFVYGNHGSKMNYEDQGFIQGLLEHGQDLRGKRLPFYRPTPECVAAVEKILAGESNKL